MIPDANRKLVLENGEEYYGLAFGADCERVTEVVFNTSMVGYQEILSDPSYTDQAVVMTYPLIGNYGMAPEDYETERPTIGALIVREYNPEPSSWRSTATLESVMKKYDIPGLAGIDTRRLAWQIRDKGCCKGLLCPADTSLEDALRTLRQTELRHDAVSRVSCKKTWIYRARSPKHLIAAIDCGMKTNIVRSLNRAGCDVAVLPYNSDADDVLRLSPDGIFLSNGPGDPTDAPEVVRLVQDLKGKLPMFGICLGHQIISLAYGAETYKLKFGHRGGNHPVRNELTGKIEMTSQNHSYAVRTESLAGTGLTVTHTNLLDGTVEGVQCVRDRVFSVQYHPESAPGPQDSTYLFGRFFDLMEESHA